MPGLDKDLFLFIYVYVLQNKKQPRISAELSILPSF